MISVIMQYDECVQCLTVMYQHKNLWCCLHQCTYFSSNLLWFVLVRLKSVILNINFHPLHNI